MWLERALLARVIEHCSQVRDDLGRCKRNVFTKRQQQAVLPAVGGIQLSVDMSTAFDRVPRAALRHSLVWAGASAELVDAIDQLHAQCKYHIQHAGFSGAVYMMRGVRQGCTLAPILFSVFSCFLADQIGRRTNMAWMHNALTLYADDSHASWTIHDATDFMFAERCVRVIHRVFSEFGMKVNPLKSVVVCSLQGRLSKQWCRQKIQKSSRGVFLCLGPVHDQIRIPIQSSMVYLGVVVSYGNYELQTMQHRLQIARASRQRLIKILHSSQHLGVHKRLELYMACVRSSAIYGVNAVGHTSASLNLLRTFEQKHVRAIARSPSHVSRETTAALYLRLGIKEPDVALLSILEAQCKHLTRLGRDIEDWRKISMQALQDYITAKGSGLREISVDKSCPCPTCGLYFANRSAMRQHHKKIHHVSLVPEGKKDKDVRNRVVIHEHSIDGVPICRHCGKQFENFSNLKAHVLDCGSAASSGLLGPNGRTLDMTTGKPAWQPSAGLSTELATPLIQRQDVLTLLREKQWQSVLAMPGIVETLRNFCGICGQWLSSSPSALRNHVKHIHADALPLCADAVFRSSTLTLTRTKPCGACGVMTSGATKHRCSLMFHLCLLDLYSQARTVGRSTLTRRHGFALRSASSSSAVPNRRGQPVLSAYFQKRCGAPAHPCNLQHKAGLNDGGKAAQVDKGQREGRCRKGPRQRLPEAQARQAARDHRGGAEAGPILVELEAGQLEPGKGSDERHDQAPCQDGSSPRGRAEPSRVEREFVLAMEVHGGGILPMMYEVAQTWKDAREKEQAFTSLRMAMFLALIQEWMDRLDKVLEPQAKEGAIKLGIAQLDSKQDLEWLYLLWDMEAKKMVPDSKKDAVQHTVFMAWLKELQLLIASTQSLLRFHSTRPLAESYQGETVTFLLTLGHRDQAMDRAHKLLTLMCGLGATKVAAFRIRPARMERQPLAKIIEERFPAPARGYPRRQQRPKTQQVAANNQDRDME